MCRVNPGNTESINQMRHKESSGRRKQDPALHSASGMLHAVCCISARGQAMVEYVVIAGLLMACVGILTVFTVTFKEYGGRILSLVSSEYP